MKRTRQRRRRAAIQLPTRSQFRPARNLLTSLGDDQLPVIRQWESLLVDEVRKRFPTKTEQAQALGLTREGYRKKLVRMGLE